MPATSGHVQTQCLHIQSNSSTTLDKKIDHMFTHQHGSGFVPKHCYVASSCGSPTRNCCGATLLKDHMPCLHARSYMCCLGGHQPAVGLPWDPHHLAPQVLLAHAINFKVNGESKLGSHNFPLTLISYWAELLSQARPPARLRSVYVARLRLTTYCPLTRWSRPCKPWSSRSSRQSHSHTHLMETLHSNTHLRERGLASRND